MKDTNRTGVIIGLGLLFLVLALIVPNLHFDAILRPLRHVSPWVIFAFIWLLFCCRGGCCGRRRCRKDWGDEDAVEA